LLAALFGGACASLGDPPGGPPDIAPPKIVHIQPESGAVVPKFNGDLVVQFDEVIDEMPGSGGGGSGSLARQILLSPVAGNVKVTWHRSSISVKPREGWKPRVYRLEVLPGIMDLRRNRFDTARVVLFSRRPEIGHARIGGIALGWVDQRIIPRALIEAVPAPDTVGYLTLADSGGQFNLATDPFASIGGGCDNVAGPGTLPTATCSSGTEAILGGSRLSPYAAALRGCTPLVVIEPLACAVALAESLARLGLRQSKAGKFARPPRPLEEYGR